MTCNINDVQRKSATCCEKTQRIEKINNVLQNTNYVLQIANNVP